MRKYAIRGLIKAYQDPTTSEGNKKEIKKALKGELSLIIHEPEESITDFLLQGWMENEMRTNLEEELAKELGLPPYNPEEDEVVFTLPNLKTPEEYKKDNDVKL